MQQVSESQRRNLIKRKKDNWGHLLFQCAKCGKEKKLSSKVDFQSKTWCKLCYRYRQPKAKRANED